MRPTNDAQAIIASQLAALGPLMLMATGEAARSTAFSGVSLWSSEAVKLAKASALLADSLARLQRGGEQRVVVQHAMYVTVAKRSLVPFTSPHWGAAPKREEQPHERITTVSRGCPRMCSKNSGRWTLQAGSNAWKATMRPSRWKISRCAGRKPERPKARILHRSFDCIP